MYTSKRLHLPCVAFPKFLTAEMLAGFRTTERGCTRPRVGEIAGTKFIAKCGSWSAYSSDKHVHNEFIADNFLRAAGLNVPVSREYAVDFEDGLGFQVIRLAAFQESARPLMEVWPNADAALKRKIREQAVRAYPVQAFIAGIDTFTYDNVLVDPDGNLVFVDNGASFNYRACGKKKGWFWKREDVDDPRSGYLSLYHHPDQGTLRKVIGEVGDDLLWAMATQYRFTRLVMKSPDTHRRKELIQYAKALDIVARERTAQ